MARHYVYRNSTEGDKIAYAYKEDNSLQLIDENIIDYLVSLGFSPISVVGSLCRVFNLRAREVKRAIHELNSNDELKREIEEAEDNFSRIFQQMSQRILSLSPI